VKRSITKMLDQGQSDKAEEVMFALKYNSFPENWAGDEETEYMTHKNYKYRPRAPHLRPLKGDFHNAAMEAKGQVVRSLNLIRFGENRDRVIKRRADNAWESQGCGVKRLGNTYDKATHCRKKLHHQNSPTTLTQQDPSVQETVPPGGRITSASTSTNAASLEAQILDLRRQLQASERQQVRSKPTINDACCLFFGTHVSYCHFLNRPRKTPVAFQ